MELPFGVKRDNQVERERERERREEREERILFSRWKGRESVPP